MYLEIAACYILLYLTVLSKHTFLMKNAEFGAYLKALREEKKTPQRKVAHATQLAKIGIEL